MTYFHKENWQSDWIDTARQLLRDEWDKYYKPCIDVSFLEEAGITTNASNLVSIQFSSPSHRPCLLIFDRLSIIYLQTVMVGQVLKMSWMLI